MSAKKNDKPKMLSISSTSTPTDLRADDGFIDDYSHLRLSYYQHREGSFEDTVTSELSYDPNLTDSENTSTSEETAQTELSFEGTVEDLERKKLREYYVSQIPDLPHPSFMVASIISSASRSMSGSFPFKYHNQIEQGTNSCTTQDRNKEKFVPNRRSTLKPQIRK